MQAILLQISGRWGHFKKPETNNNPLTHDLITKTALVGMIGAVLGIERETMKPLFPTLCEDLLYGVALQHRVRKQSWGFTLRRFSKDFRHLESEGPAPRPFEILVAPSFQVVLALADSRSAETFAEFSRLTRNGESHYDPVLGLHNCPAQVEWLAEGITNLGTGTFQTHGFIPRAQRPTPTAIGAPFRLGMERLPTYQNNDMWNPPDRYIEVVYPDRISPQTPAYLGGEGPYHHIRWSDGKEEDWCLI